MPEGLARGLAPTFHLIEAATRMHLASMGQMATCVPFEYQKKTKMTLYKGDAALETRRAVASKLTPSLITALQRPRRLDDKPDWAPMQQLYDAGLSYDPISGMPVFDPSGMKPGFQKALWRTFCGVADTINTKQMGQTDEALEELQMRLHEHAAQLREVAPRSRRLSRSDGTLAKRSRGASPAASLSDEGTDTGAPRSLPASIVVMFESAAELTRRGGRLLRTACVVNT